VKVETEELMPIGRFARLSGLTVKALRHYDELGLIKPAFVDGWTGYRSYHRGGRGDRDPPAT
jgi:DNA-binding transcriptional MerR regulator